MDRNDLLLAAARAIPDSPGWAYLEARGLTGQTINQFNLGYDPQQNAIVIPLFDIRKVCRQLRWRYLAPNAHPKYRTESATGRHLWGVDATLESHVVITEGEFDAMIVRQLGIPACAYSGTQNFVKSWAYLFRDCELVTVIGDGDDEGRKAMTRIAQWVGYVVGDDVREVEMPSGMDATDLYLRDPGELERRLAL